MTRHQRRFKPFTRPVCPSPVAHRMERRALGLLPELRTPPGTLATHVRPGPGHRARTWNNALSHRPSLQSCVFSRCVRPRVAGPLVPVYIDPHRPRRVRDGLDERRTPVGIADGEIGASARCLVVLFRRPLSRTRCDRFRSPGSPAAMPLARLVVGGCRHGRLRRPRGSCVVSSP